MKERFNDIDDKSRNAAQNIRIAFDDSAWDKMEALLNEENKKPVAPVVSNILTAGKSGSKERRWVLLFLIFLLMGAAILIIKNSNTLKNKTLPLVNSKDKSLDKKTREINEEGMVDIRVKKEQFINRYQQQQRSVKNNAGNENFKPKATNDNKTTLSVTTNSSYKKDEKVSNKKRKPVAKKNDLFNAFNDREENRKINLQQEIREKVVIENSQSEIGEVSNSDLIKIENQLLVKNEKNKKSTEERKDSSWQQMNVPLDINKKDLVNAAITNKNKKPAVSLKNKFFKNIGFSIFASPETNTVKFKGSDKVTVGYGAGINYTIGRHFTLQAQFANTRKVYVTDRKGYNPTAGSPLIPIDTLQVNADCKVWDIPLNLRYSFTDNTKNSFFISAGISSYIMKKEIYDFAYYDQGAYETKNRIIENENKHSFCNLNLSVGYQYWLNKKWSIGFEPYLKLPLSGVGAGKVKLTSAGAIFNLTFKPIKATR